MKIVKNAVVLSLVVGAAAVAADVNAAGPITTTGPITAYVRITGSKQGAFKGDETALAHKGESLLLGLDYSTSSPVDLATGQATGKRQHSPFVFVKEFDGSSPQIFNAAATNETLKVEVLLFRGTQPNPVVTYVLTNAVISEVHHSMTTPCVAGAPCKATGIDANIVGPDEPTETVALIFQKIELTYGPTKAVAIDDWTAGL
jgi:type VI secretion system secreted protein Hcp